MKVRRRENDGRPSPRSLVRRDSPGSRSRVGVKEILSSLLPGYYKGSEVGLIGGGEKSEEGDYENWESL